MKFTLYLFAVLSFAGFALARGVAKGRDCTSADCNTGLTCENNVCKVNAGANCTSDADCITGATCPSDSKKCACGETMTPNMNNTKCLKYMGGQCTNATDCANSNHTDCTGNKCTCKPNYTGDENSACKLKLGQECTKAEDCYGQNAECKNGTTKKCTCKTGYFADGQHCAKKVGEACTVKGDCPMNGECKEEKCACMANYMKADNGFCKSSGSAVIGSVLMLLVAFMTSRLL